MVNLDPNCIDPEFLSPVRAKQLRKQYGLCSDEFLQMYRSQDGKCAICGDPLCRPHVDHDHETNEVRALLCSNCNTGLGMFQESLDRLESAVTYLERWNQRRRPLGVVDSKGPKQQKIA